MNFFFTFAGFKDETKKFRKILPNIGFLANQNGASRFATHIASIQLGKAGCPIHSSHLIQLPEKLRELLEIMESLMKFVFFTAYTCGQCGHIHSRRTKSCDHFKHRHQIENRQNTNVTVNHMYKWMYSM